MLLKEDGFVCLTGCGILSIFWCDVLISLFHSRKLYVNLLKKMVKIIVVSWRCRRVAECWLLAKPCQWEGMRGRGDEPGTAWLHKEPAEQGRGWFSVPLQINHSCKAASLPPQTSKGCRYKLNLLDFCIRNPSVFQVRSLRRLYDIG